MDLFSVIAILLSTTAAFAYINGRHLKLPSAVGLMLSALVFSAVIMMFGKMFPGMLSYAKNLVLKFNFSRAVLQGVLSFLLFAGALSVSTLELRREKGAVAALATVGVVISTIIIGFALHGIMRFGGIELPIMYCFVFGALISPTDAVAALSTLRKSKLPKYVEARIIGESLFNDGTGLILFFIFLTLAVGQYHLTGVNVVWLFLKQIFGGILLGLVFGLFFMELLKRTAYSRIRVLITLACATGVYALARSIDVSAPIAVVVAGLWIGSHKSMIPEDEENNKALEVFWELVDEVLSAILFVFIGLYLLVLPLEAHELFAGLLAIPAVLLARLVSVGSIMAMFRLGRRKGPMSLFLITWGGIRGGISIALALSLTDETAREIIVSITYIIVAFSVLVQGLTIKRFIPHETTATDAS